MRDGEDARRNDDARRHEDTRPDDERRAPGSADGGAGPRAEAEGGSSKSDVADRERGERAYEETYGRGAGERFRSADYPHAYGSPGGLDWRRALRAYVNGHDRGWEADRKFAVASDEAEGASPARGERAERHPDPDAGASKADEATARTDRGTPFGVGVADPSEMSFHRGASTWRDRLPAAPRMPRHASRELDGRRGRGDQA